MFLSGQSFLFLQPPNYYFQGILSQSPRLFIRICRNLNKLHYLASLFASLFVYKDIIFGQHANHKTKKKFPEKENFFRREFFKVSQNRKLLLQHKKQNILIYKSFSFPNRQFLLFYKSEKFSTFLDFQQKKSICYKRKTETNKTERTTCKSTTFKGRHEIKNGRRKATNDG